MKGSPWIERRRHVAESRIVVDVLRALLVVATTAKGVADLPRPAPWEWPPQMRAWPARSA